MSDSNTEPTTEEIDDAFANEEVSFSRISLAGKSNVRIFQLFTVDGVTEDDPDFNITQFQTEMEDKLNDIVEEYTKIAEEWKTGLMNQYLLNEDVSIYDWSQGESRCIGPVHRPVWPVRTVRDG